MLAHTYTHELIKKAHFDSLPVTLFISWCRSYSRRFSMITFSRESWAGEGRACVSSPPLLPHTSFSL